MLHNKLYIHLEKLLVGPLFKKSPQATIFYPWGFLSNGYLIKDDNLENRLRLFIVSFYSTVYLILILFIVFSNYIVNVFMAVILMIIYNQIIKRIFLKNSKKVFTRLTFNEHLQIQAQNISIYLIRFIQIFLLVFIAISLTNIAIGRFDFFSNFLILISFSFLLYLSQRIIKIKKYLPKEQ